MAGTHGQLTSEPLHGGDYGAFNWIFLIEYILCGILCLWFLFYFNRIFATLISYAIRLYTWHRLGVYVDIEAFQISLLAGRVFFKSIRYHGDNETIFVHGGYITWRYWLRKVKKSSLFEDHSKYNRYSRVSGSSKRNNVPSSKDPVSEETDAKLNDNLPCRIEVRVSGVEAFIYNRSPAYDWILESCDNKGSSTETAQADAPFTSHSEKTGYTDLNRGRQADGQRHLTGSNISEPDTSSKDNISEKQNHATFARPSHHRPPSPPSFLRMLPIYVHCNKAAAVLGNEGTTSILTAKIDTADGTFDASEAGPLDVFKILMQFRVNKPIIHMKPNVDFKKHQLAEASLLDPSENSSVDQLSGRAEKTTSEKKSSRAKTRWGHLPGFSKKALESLESVARFPRSSSGNVFADGRNNHPEQQRWLGLTRYLDDEQRKDEDEWRDVEYAKASTLADLNSVDFKFYWDIAGPKPAYHIENDGGCLAAGSSLDINGDKPPDYGMELFVHGGQVFYGPWADRHRVFLQQLFFPAPFADAKPTPRISTGETRLCSIFNLFLSIESDTVLRIPFREPSKDYRWKGRKDAATQRKEGTHSRERKRTGKRRNTNSTLRSTYARPYAWFDIRVKSDSTITYKQDMFPSLVGYKNELRVDVSGIEIFSSLNHALLWRSGQIAMKADLSYPLKWNDLREWTFGIGVHDLDFFLLRDHTFLLMDLIEDWTTGPLPDFLTFVPYRYILKPTFERFRLFLNVNDANIIDKSDEIEDNDFVILYGRDLISELVIPIDRFRPATNEIAFDVVAHDLGFQLSMPPKNTLNAFLSDKDVAQLPDVELKGTYVLCSEVRPGLVEQLNMEIVGRGLRIAFYGFFARHLAKIKENYFGDDIHFRTLQEYQELARNNFKSSEPPAPVRGNNLDVILDITAEDAHILLPAGLYSCREFIELYVAAANVDLRVNNYYLELMVDSSPLQLLHCARSLSSAEPTFMLSDPQITIDSVNVYGHRLFGLQPSEPAYVSNWDISAGDILGDCLPEFISKVVGAAQALALTITDEENGLPISVTEPVYDTTFVRWRSTVIRLWLNVVSDAFLISATGISGSFNDFARENESQNLVLSAPEIVAACVGSSKTDSKHAVGSMRDTHGYFKTAVNVRMIQHAADFAQLKQGQQEHIGRHDAPTGRAPFLTGSLTSANKSPPVSLCLPFLPAPLTSSGIMCASKLAPGAESDSVVKVLSGTLTTEEDSHTKIEHDVTGEKNSFTQSLFVKPDVPSGRSIFDMNNVPEWPSPIAGTGDAKHNAREGNMFDLSSDEETVHTSVSIQAIPGVIVMCKPQVVLAVGHILQAVSPKEPEAVFDQFQAETVIGVLSMLKKQRGKRFMLDLGITIPFFHARLINTGVHQDGKVRNLIDEYDLVAYRTSSAVRIKSVPERKHADDLKAVHLTVAAITLSAKQSDHTADDQGAALKAYINNIFLWLADSDRTVVNASYDLFQGTVASREIEYLTALVYRAIVVGSSLAKPFIDLQAHNAQRRRYVAYSLTRKSEGIADPSFLTRPAYMIRSAQDHLRNDDAWKVVARLRWIFCSLSQKDYQYLWRSCTADVIDTPLDCEKFVLDVLDQWRSWDAVHVKDSLATQLLFGHRTEAKKAHDPGSVPLSISLHGMKNKIVIDHGPRQNEAKVDGLTVAVSVTPPSPQAAMRLFHEYQDMKSTIVHIGSSCATLDLNWDLCEMVDEMMSLFKGSDLAYLLASDSQDASAAISSTDVYKQPGLGGEKIHVVLQLDNAEINIQAINIDQSLTSQDLKVSIVGSGLGAKSTNSMISVIASADLASTSTRRDSQSLLESHLKNYSVGITFEQTRASHNERKTLGIAGSALSLFLQSHGDISRYIETADHVLHHEVKHITKIIEKHLPTSENIATNAAPSHSTPLQYHLALFLDSYRLQVHLLQDLRYFTDGRVLRLSVQPDRVSEQSKMVGIDLKAQRHTLLRGQSDRPLVSSVIELPPINGTIRTLYTPTLMTLSISILVEELKLEGTALYAIFRMLTTPGITQAVRSLQQDVISLQESISSVFPPTPSLGDGMQASPSPASMVIFDANLRLVGLSMFARTYERRFDKPKSEVTFSLGSTSLKTTNQAGQSDRPLPFPELHLSLGKIAAEVKRQQDMKLAPSANITFAMSFVCTVRPFERNKHIRHICVRANGPAIEIDEHTIPIIVDLLAHFQEKLRGIDLSKERHYMKKLRHPGTVKNSSIDFDEAQEVPADDNSTQNIITSVEFALESAYVMYIISDDSARPKPRDIQNIAFSLKRVDFITQGEKKARLRIEEVKLQLLPTGSSWTQRSANSAVLPEVVFTVGQQSSSVDRRLLFRAAGQALDIQFHPNVVKPIVTLERSLADTADRTRSVISQLRTEPSSGLSTPKLSIGSRRLTALVISINFAGAVIRLLERDLSEPKSGNFASLSSNQVSGLGRYSNLSPDSVAKDAILKAPGIAVRIQYADPVDAKPCLNLEIQIDESNNVLTPAVVPLILRIARNVKTTMHHGNMNRKEGDVPLPQTMKAQQINEESIVQRNPRALLGRTSLNIGMRIGKQQFALICQPIAKVEARMKLEDTYLTISTIDVGEGGTFFAGSVTFTGMQASLQHVYSRDATFKFDIESIVVSVMNSKHISGTTGISAMLKINPMKAQLNAKQLQDILLFREIWLPPELRGSSLQNVSHSLEEQHEYFVAKYRQIAASAAFPWNATVVIADLSIELDLGQAIGKLSSHISKLWASSKKTTTSHQTLCIGIGSMSVDASGRMSGFVQLNKVKIRMYIAWPSSATRANQTPLVQGSVGFKELRLKAAFDYQIFAISHITSFEFIMYNVRDRSQRTGDRLVAILDGAKVHLYCVASTAALAVSLIQAFERLIQERKASYEQALRDIDAFLRRESSFTRSRTTSQATPPPTKEHPANSTARPTRFPLSLHTDVVVTLGALDIGAFPRTVMDNQILRLETSDVQARFAVVMEGSQLHSGLGLTLGQVRAALAEVPHAGVPKSLGDIRIDEVVGNAASARGGVILRVPKVVAAMQTWQQQDSSTIDYKFRSTFEGKIDVGWNYARISFIRGMWATHSRTLATRLGKPLPQSALKISGPQPLPEQRDERAGESAMTRTRQQQKITVTANVDLPQSGYTYRALEPAVIDTPQLRDMGEATPPLEWIGLHRDKLPNVTHQVVIVTLLEVAKEVEDAYGKILGSA